MVNDHESHDAHGGEHTHTHGHADGHGHGHANDQGIKGALRYLRWLPSMWRSEINDAVVDLIAAQPNERVVDIGAGMGAGAMRAAATGAHVTAVEPTPFMRRVLTARRTFSRRRANVAVVDGAAEQIPVEDQSIDAIWAVNTMHHWISPEQGVAEIVRVLRPTGRILLVDEDFANPSHPEHDRFGSNDDDDGHHHGFTMVDAQTIGELLQAAGMSEIDTSNDHLAKRPVISIAARGTSH